jgi:hypothetical protein
VTSDVSFYCFLSSTLTGLHFLLFLRKVPLHFSIIVTERRGRVVVNSLASHSGDPGFKF